MERETIKDGREYVLKGSPESLARTVNKLGRLEDIEQELNFSIETLLKGIINGIVFYSGSEIVEDTICNIYKGKYKGKECYYFDTYYENNTYLLSEYGEEWALEEEDLPREEEDY